MEQLEHTEKVCHHYLLNLWLPIHFSVIQGDLCTIHPYLDLVYKFYNTINQDYHK